MKFTLEEFLARLQTAIDNLPQAAFDSYVETAANAKALIDRRIVETGKNNKGVSLQDIKNYTEAWLKIKQGKKVGKKVIRSNKYAGFVNLNYTGQMWSDIKVLVRESTVSINDISIKVGAENQLDLKKVSHNAEIWGDFLSVSDQELEMCAEVLDTEIQNKLDYYFK